MITKDGLKTMINRIEFEPIKKSKEDFIITRTIRISNADFDCGYYETEEN